MELRIIKNEIVFKENLVRLKEYFNDMMRKGVISPMYEEAYKPLKATFDIVFNNEILYGLQEKMAILWPIKDSFIEGENFLDSDIGKLYQEVIYYFAYYYKVPDNQKGGYNIHP